jgi:hypothetical protein
MFNYLRSLRHQITTLELFEAKYRIGDHHTCVHSLSPGGTPHVVFYPDRDGSHDWAVAKFGAEGWEESDAIQGLQSVNRLIDGVKVTLHAAYPVAVSHEEPRPVNPARLLSVATRS